MKIILIVFSILLGLIELIPVRENNRKENIENKYTLLIDSLFIKNHELINKNDSLKEEIEMCKWTGKREYYSINKNVK